MDETLRLILAFMNMKSGGGGGGDSSGCAKWRGSVDYVSGLPADAEEGDCYTVKYAGTSGTVLDGTTYLRGMDGADGMLKWIALGGMNPVKVSVADNTLNIEAGATVPLAILAEGNSLNINF